MPTITCFSPKLLFLTFPIFLLPHLISSEFEMNLLQAALVSFQLNVCSQKTAPLWNSPENV